MSGGILHLINETLIVRVKSFCCKRHFQRGPIQKLHPILYDNIDEELIKKAAIRTKEVFRLSDADGWQRIIVLSCFGTATSDLHKTIAELVKTLCITNILFFFFLHCFSNFEDMHIINVLS